MRDGYTLSLAARDSRSVPGREAVMITTVRCPACGTSSSVSTLDAVQGYTCRCGQSLDPSSDAIPILDSSLLVGSSSFDASSTNADLPAKVGKYQIRRRIGVGGFGTVYEAYDEKLDRLVALKVAHTALMQSESLQNRFIREGKAAARINHEGIVKVYDADTDGKLFYIASELVHGRTLGDILESGLLDRPRAVQIAIDIAQALALTPPALFIAT